jgi:TadE-like protein
MRKRLHRLLRVLDGTPAEWGRGQTLVEIAFIAPILIITFAGMVEIGWFASNYLALLDVSRNGARFGSMQSGDTSPLVWNDTASLASSDTVAAEVAGFWYVDPADPSQHQRRQARNCDGQLTGFYTAVGCMMIESMQPLPLRKDNSVDDIVISVFSLAQVNGRVLGSHRPFSDSGPQVVVVGRYPMNANECDVSMTAGNPVLQPHEPRDPFDVNENHRQDADPNGLTEIPGYDAIGSSVTNAEKQVGFAWFGHHVIQGTGCVGSDWTAQRVEEAMNLQNYVDGGDVQQRQMLPGQGLVLVEMFWQHELLLKIPVFSPVYSILGDRTTISVWAAFPMPSVEPVTPLR